MGPQTPMSKYDGSAFAGMAALRGTPMASYEKSVNSAELPFSPAPW